MEASTPSSTQRTQSGGKRSRLLNDPVHGLMELDDYIFDWVDSPQYQRLRYLKQLGATSFVYTGAVHTRFEHSIGVAHLSNTMVKRWQLKQPELCISEDEVRSVTIAGLCHDLGHGPFSHSFEQWMRIKDGEWHHEDRSKELVELIVEDNALDYDLKQIRMIQSLINGVDPREQHLDRAFLYEVVANKRNGIDVDKFDYLARDTFFCGLPKADFSTRLLLTNRVIGDQVCYQRKESMALYNLFAKRYEMFKMVYNHPVATAVETMIMDILSASDDYLGIRQRASTIQDYQFLTDSILNEIESCRAPELQKAHALLRRLRKRDLYKRVGSSMVGFQFVDWSVRDHSERLVGYCNGAVTVDDVNVRVVPLNYGMKDQNPINNTRFYDNANDGVCFKLKPKDVSRMLPHEFAEANVSCICKTPEKREIILQGWTRYLAQEFGISGGTTNDEDDEEFVQATPIRGAGTSKSASPAKRPKI